MEMFGSVFARRIIAAAYMAAGQAKAEVNPACIAREAFLAALWRARLDGAHLIEVFADGIHVVTMQSSSAAVQLLNVLREPATPTPPPLGAQRQRKRNDPPC